MGLVPVQFSATDFSVGKPDQRHSLELPPTTSAEPGLEALPLPDGEVNCYRLNVFDIAKQLEIPLQNSSVAAYNLAGKRVNPRRAVASWRHSA